MCAVYQIYRIVILHQQTMVKWRSVFPDAGGVLSFQDDHHFGGSIKHLYNFKGSSNEMLRHGSGFWIVGAYGQDETSKFTVFHLNSDDPFSQFLTSAFLGQVHVSPDSLDFDTDTDLIVDVTFYKLSSIGPRRLKTKWMYDAGTKMVKIEFDDLVPNTIEKDEAGNVATTSWRTSNWMQMATPLPTEAAHLKLEAEKYVTQKNLTMMRSGHVVYTDYTKNLTVSA